VRALPRSFYARDAREVAPELLNKVLVRGSRRGRIVEVEAYAGGEDPASHGYRGLTPRTATMFGRPGRLYVYFTYGMHFCANAVCGEEGVSSAVLLRSLAPLDGLDEMRAARGPAARRDRDLCSGPAKLCQAFGIDRALDGADLVEGDDVRIVDDGTAPPAEPGRTVRIGISVATEHPWRWFVPGEPNLSRPG
jgi:DNA-3-methyladenine glycosylase